MGRKRDKLDAKDFLQVVAGASIPAILVYASPTTGPTSVGLGFILFVGFYLLAYIGMIATFKSTTASLALQHLVIASIVSFLIAAFLGIFWQGLSVTTFASTGFFMSEAMISFAAGLIGGALADAARD